MEQQILTKLEKIVNDIREIQELMEPDHIMNEDDRKALDAYRKEKKAGKLVSHKTVKNELA
ncbi:MAG: hypothetical protein KKA90_00695 [Nanoarchaeota archaeon]|nr:hypothetical protein [Nanoarchaeota archaeon]